MFHHSVFYKRKRKICQGQFLFATKSTSIQSQTVNKLKIYHNILHDLRRRYSSLITTSPFGEKWGMLIEEKNQEKWQRGRGYYYYFFFFWEGGNSFSHDNLKNQAQTHAVHGDISGNDHVILKNIYLYLSRTIVVKAIYQDKKRKTHTS